MFVGRKDILAQMETEFHASANVHSRMGLVGLGGIG